MSEPTDGDTRLIVLRMAHEILHNQYVEHKMKLHNEWALSAASLWSTQGTKLAYPPLPPYPSEIRVVSAAQVLLKFLCEPDADDLPVSEPSGMPEELTTNIMHTDPEPPYMPPTSDVSDHELMYQEELIQPESILKSEPVVETTARGPHQMSEDADRTRMGLLPSWFIRSNRTSE